MSQPPIGSTIVLDRGTIDHSQSVSITVLRLLPNEARTAGRGAELLVVVDEYEQRIKVDIGETCTVQNQVWRLESIVDEIDFAATISRIS